MTEQTNSRLGGLVLLALAGLGMWWNERDLQADASYSPKLVFIVPFVAAMGLDLLVHAPKMPVNRMTPREALYMVVGCAAGVLNLDRYGFFSPNSALKPALLWGLGLAAVVTVVLLLRRVTER